MLLKTVPLMAAQAGDQDLEEPLVTLHLLKVLVIHLLILMIGRVEGIRCPLILILLQHINFHTFSRHPQQRMRSNNSRLWHHLLIKTSEGVQCLMSRITMHQFGLLDEVRPHETVQAMEVPATEGPATEVQAMVV